MAQRPCKPAGIEWLTPYLMVRDVDAALNFYVEAFGFEKAEQMPGPDGRLVHAGMRYKSVSIAMLGLEGACGAQSSSPATTGVNCAAGLYLYVDDVDQALRRAVDAGCRAIMEPRDEFWGDRIAAVLDPEGYQWTLATNVADFDPSKAPAEVAGV